MRFELDCVDESALSAEVGATNVVVEAVLLLTSLPNIRAAVVNARGRPSGRGLSLTNGLAKADLGAGEMSMASAYSLSGVRAMGSRGGEFSETFEANESSRSEERNSSISSCCRGRRSGRLRKGAEGALRNCVED